MKLVDIVKKQFKRNGFFTSVFKVGSGNLIGQGIAIITTPILSRIYNDVAYGDRAIVISTAAIICNIATLGLNSAIMKPEDDLESKKVFSTAFFMNVTVSTILTVICLLLNNFFHIINVTGSYALGLLLMWLYMIAYTTQSLVLIYTNRKGRYNRLFFNPLIGAFANIVIAIPLGLLGFGYEGFLVTVIISQILQVVHMTWKDIPIYPHYRFSDLIAVLKKYKEYIFFQYPSNFLMNTGTEYPTQFLGRNFTSVELGNYSMCLNILKYPIRLVAGPISTVYFKTATDYHRQGKNLAGFTYKIVTRILLISFIPIAICCYFAEQLFSFALGAAWAAAGTIAAIKAIEYIMLFCSDCVGYCRVSIGKQRSNLVYAIIRLTVIVLFSAAGYSIFHSLIGTIALITVGNTLLNILDMAINFYYLGKEYLWKYALIAVTYACLIGTEVYLLYFV